MTFSFNPQQKQSWASHIEGDWWSSRVKSCETDPGIRRTYLHWCGINTVSDLRCISKRNIRESTEESTWTRWSVLLHSRVVEQDRQLQTRSLWARTCINAEIGSKTRYSNTWWLTTSLNGQTAANVLREFSMTLTVMDPTSGRTRTQQLLQRTHVWTPFWRNTKPRRRRNTTEGLWK